MERNSAGEDVTIFVFFQRFDESVEGEIGHLGVVEVWWWGPKVKVI